MNKTFIALEISKKEARMAIFLSNFQFLNIPAYSISKPTIRFIPINKELYNYWLKDQRNLPHSLVKCYE